MGIGRTVARVGAWIGLGALGGWLGCTQPNESHCGNQKGDVTCAQRDSDFPLCNLCVAVNDGCVKGPIEDSGCAWNPDAADGGTGPATAGSATVDTGADDSSSGGPCGNGAIEPGEECDGEFIPAGNDCADQGFGEGLPGCAEDCTLDYSVCPEFVGCGDGDLAPKEEECDGKDFGSSVCDDFPNHTGQGLACNDDCTIDPSGCDMCVEGGDLCARTGDCCDQGLVCRVGLDLMKRCCMEGMGECLFGDTSG